jgi:PiT family inorganic phosphate transporter
VLYYVVAIIAVAFLFDFSNGFHDSANSIATIVGTRVLSPLAAVCWGAFFNFIAAFTVGTAVAKAIATGMLQPDAITPHVVLAGLLGALTWNIITWYFGLPSSSSHALIGGYAGGAIARAGWAAIIWGTKWKLILLFIVLSPLVGMAAGWSTMVIVHWVFRGMSPGRVNRFFRVAQLASSASMSVAHGANDAQKTMGVIVALLISMKPLMATQTGIWHNLYVGGSDVPFWVAMAAYTSIALGTLAGGWRIVKTMGLRITKLKPVGGFSAETGGAVALFIASHFGIPVSTTHTITGSIIGVGASVRVSAVRWGIARRIVYAWIITIPAAGAMAALCYWGLNSFWPM